MAGEKRKAEENKFISGVLVLTLSAIIVKIIGLVYKIPMLRLLGSEGMGYFNSAYEIYALFCTVATTGLPVAMSVMISSLNDERGDERVFRISMRLFFCLGAVGCAIMIAFARPFAAFLGNAQAAYCIAAISPTVFFICLASAYRGYFQGKGKMLPTALSQIIEALCKLILGLLLALVALNSGFSTEIVAAFAVMGLTLGVATSLLYLSVAKRMTRTNGLPFAPQSGEKGIAKRLLKIAIPVTLSSAVVSVTRVLDMSMILRRLQDAGYSGEDAFAAYGNYTTLAIPLFSLAPTLVSSVALPLVPSLSGAVAQNDTSEQMRIAERALKLTALISAPASLGLALFSRPVLELIFSGEDAAIAAATPSLAILGIAVIASCIITVENAMLQAYGMAHVPLISMGIGTLVKITVAWMLLGNERFGLVGAPIGTLICDAVICSINFYFIGKRLPSLKIISRVLLRPFLAAAISVVLSRVTYNAICLRFGESRVITLVSIALSAVLYLLLVLLLGAIDKEDLASLPIIGRSQKAKIENNNTYIN